MIREKQDEYEYHIREVEIHPEHVHLLIGSGHVLNVVHTTTETQTLLSTSNRQAWLPKVETT